MATLTQSFLTLADVYKRMEKQGVADIIEMMNDTSQDILGDIQMVECNDGTKHTHTIRTGLPSVAWGALYAGTPQSKSTTQQVDDTTGFVEALCTIDKRVLALAGENANAVRASESLPFIESMAQELVTAMFYHNSATDARKPRGLSARFGVKATSGYGNQIVDAGGSSTDNTSMWFVTHGLNGLIGLYPKGTSGGISQEDKGEQRVLDGSGNPYYVVEELVTAHMGFAVKDYRNIVRIANLDVSDMLAGSVKIYNFMRQAYYKLNTRRAAKVKDQMTGGRTVIYCNKTVLEALHALNANMGSSDNFIRLRPMELDGQEVMSYMGFPIRETDALLNTESRVV
jgi:hypothetical protein